MDPTKIAVNVWDSSGLPFFFHSVLMCDITLFADPFLDFFLETEKLIEFQWEVIFFKSSASVSTDALLLLF